MPSKKKQNTKHNPRKTTSNRGDRAASSRRSSKKEIQSDDSDAGGVSEDTRRSRKHLKQERSDSESDDRPVKKLKLVQAAGKAKGRGRRHRKKSATPSESESDHSSDTYSESGDDSSEDESGSDLSDLIADETNDESDAGSEEYVHVDADAARECSVDIFQATGPSSVGDESQKKSSDSTGVEVIEPTGNPESSDQSAHGLVPEAQIGESAVDPSSATTPSVRKSARTRKASAKAAALGDPKPVTTPSEWADSDSEQKPTVYSEDIAVTSAVKPESDMSRVDRDVMLKNTYRNIVPLRSVSLSGVGDTGRTIMLSNWLNSTNASINEQFVVDLIAFKSHKSYVNLSRTDPAVLTPKLVGKGTYISYLLGNGAQTALCVSVIVVAESLIGQPGTNSAGFPRKEITGYFLAQEFERFAGCTGAVFNCDKFWTHMSNSAFKFGTFAGPGSDGSSSQFVKAPPGMFAATPSPSGATSSSTRVVLNYDSVVPLYDYRAEIKFDANIHLDPARYGKLLPSHMDLPVHSLALVVYTTTKFTMRSGEVGLGCNIMWAALLAAPGGSKLPDPPFPMNGPDNDNELPTPSKVSTSKVSTSKVSSSKVSSSKKAGTSKKK
ncbi:hypothetical protein BJ138DRAFT_1105166 [Hygrophoropsis aurantiaca]|uniref:Uncharacterized protein n=1 Tax=Hygrophoropsis aurantiaca TaxID=72124 RepID=A0ACB7ZZU0_9AGAM|nr:hypothetical protein BJ138DRAFT_1105166 [Hygrophoropsis aurantiaca]